MVFSTFHVFIKRKIVLIGRSLWGAKFCRAARTVQKGRSASPPNSLASLPFLSSSAGPAAVAQTAELIIIENSRKN
jgi:hypothetical protein